jgi:hypothetical protein
MAEYQATATLRADHRQRSPISCGSETSPSFAAILDAFSHKVVGYSVSKQMIRRLRSQHRVPLWKVDSLGRKPAFITRIAADSTGRRNTDSLCGAEHFVKRFGRSASARVFRGLVLSMSATAARALALCLLRSVPLGKYRLSKPFVFSFVRRYHGLCGSQK